jgi:hypothetical protein
MTRELRSPIAPRAGGGTGTQNCHPGGAGTQDGSGRHSGSGDQPTGGADQLGGALNCHWFAVGMTGRWAGSAGSQGNKAQQADDEARQAGSVDAETPREERGPGGSLAFCSAVFSVPGTSLG